MRLQDDVSEPPLGMYRCSACATMLLTSEPHDGGERRAHVGADPALPDPNMDPERFEQLVDMFHAFLQERSRQRKARDAMRVHRSRLTLVPDEVQHRHRLTVLAYRAQQERIRLTRLIGESRSRHAALRAEFIRAGEAHRKAATEYHGRPRRWQRATPASQSIVNDTYIRRPSR